MNPDRLRRLKSNTWSSNSYGNRKDWRGNWLAKIELRLGQVITRKSSRIGALATTCQISSTITLATTVAMNLQLNPSLCVRIARELR
jgi:hypothetical protein